MHVRIIATYVKCPCNYLFVQPARVNNLYVEESVLLPDTSVETRSIKL